MPIPFGFARFGPWRGVGDRKPQPYFNLLYTYVSQEVIESLNTASPFAYVSQEVIESFNTASPFTYVSQFVIEVLQVNIEAPMLPIYPQNLPGLAFNVKWMPTFYNMPTQITASGAQIDLAYADTPTHEFELIYEFLRDGLGQNEFKRMMGFFLRLGGTVGRFLFKNVDDYQTIAENVGTTNGTSTLYGPIKRTFGSGDNVGIEPIGYVDTTSPVRVYLNGVEQSSSIWELDQSTPGNIMIKFFAAPSASQVITIDCSYFYYCRFADNISSFEKFMNQLWQLSSIRIQSCRPGA